MSEPKQIMGYRVTIEIECETKDEIISHLIDIRHTILKKIQLAKRRKEAEIPAIEFDDNNCYGSHTVKIEHAI